MSENIFLLDSKIFQNIRLKKSRNIESKTRYIWAPLFSSGISFFYPSYMKERRYWGPVKQLLAPFVGIGTLSEKYWILSNIYDPEFLSFYISVELNKETLPRAPNYSGRANFLSESFQNNTFKGYIQRFTDEIMGEKVHVDVLSFLEGSMYSIKCYSLLDDYPFNKTIIDSIFNSVSKR